MLYIGTCGFDYPHWRGGLYPWDLPEDEHLRWYATNFGAVELDTTFYRVPTARTTERWAQRTPDDFRFAVKASRYLTHIRRLRDPAEPIDRMYRVFDRLGERLGPLILQLPPNAPIDLAALADTLHLTDRLRWPVAVEPRHPSWFTNRYFDLLRTYGATSVWTDWWGHTGPHQRTASWCYVRMHAGRAHPNGAYGERALHHWIERLAASYADHAHMYVMFNNDAHGCAPRNAARLGEIARAYGLVTSRTPPPTHIPLVA